TGVETVAPSVSLYTWLAFSRFGTAMAM
ncbi:uncharacterized protein METZ01_LOCUS303916, partial [marine metagenome]